jgi:uncharacterized glyoxalase superfamily protein PhnB
MTTRVKPVPDGYHTVTPCFTCVDAGRFMKFLTAAFEARIERRLNRADGSVGHAEVRVGNSVVMLSEASEQWPAVPISIYLYVEDADNVYTRALSAGGKSIMEPTNMVYGDRHGGVLDPWGNTWWIATRLENLSDEEIEQRGR